MVAGMRDTRPGDGNPFAAVMELGFVNSESDAGIELDGAEWGEDGGLDCFLARSMIDEDG